MTNVSVKRVPKNKLQNAIDDNISMGFTVKSQSENVAILEKSGDWGSFGWHAVIFMVTAWWTCGLWNLGYALYSHYGKKQELQLKVDKVDGE
ncbi:MAG: hypothetical protein M0P26_01045 [Bacteroidales bacterium]|jgi:hypothetical protein|nr:hypothetical protein [Bacteroidales bacterium]